MPHQRLTCVRLLLLLFTLAPAACSDNKPTPGSAASNLDAGARDGSAETDGAQRTDAGPDVTLVADGTTADAGFDVAIDVVPVARPDARASDTAQTIGNFGDRYVRTMCNKHATCCTGLGPPTNATSAEEAACVRALTSGGVPEALDAELNAELAAGNIVYDDALMALCLSDLAAASCEALRKPGAEFADFPRCKQAVRGLRANGEACNTNHACRDGWCDLGSGGICAARLPNGEACLAGDECQSHECNEDLGTCVTATSDALCGR
ncbi:MAG TPA: hypothetical protein VGF45_11910 [Polyangia bacterium]